VIYATSDGGTTWVGILGPAAEAAVDVYSCELIDNNRFWLGYGNGHLYYSNDAGATWTRRMLPIPVGATSVSIISNIRFLDEQCVFAGIRCSDGINTYGSLFRSIDGGFSWESWLSSSMVAAPLGILGIHACSYNKCYWVGDPFGGKGTVAVVSG
jgi:photosystem II stability/assembly factor-like uncharacterized protein